MVRALQVINQQNEKTLEQHLSMALNLAQLVMNPI
jgi:hypothetical protein